MVSSGCSYQKSLTTIRGTAENMKVGAVVLTENRVYYIDGLTNWEDSIDGKRVIVSGILETLKIEPNIDEDSLLIQTDATSFEFEKYVLKKAKWKLDTR